MPPRRHSCSGAMTAAPGRRIRSRRKLIATSPGAGHIESGPGRSGAAPASGMTCRRGSRAGRTRPPVAMTRGGGGLCARDRWPGPGVSRIRQRGARSLAQDCGTPSNARHDSEESIQMTSAKPDRPTGAPVRPSSRVEDPPTGLSEPGHEVPGGASSRARADASDAPLVALARQGDAGAFEELVHRHAERSTGCSPELSATRTSPKRPAGRPSVEHGAPFPASGATPRSRPGSSGSR